MFGRASYINTRKAIKSREQAISTKLEEIKKLEKLIGGSPENEQVASDRFLEIELLQEEIISLRTQIETWKNGIAKVLSKNSAKIAPPQIANEDSKQADAAPEPAPTKDEVNATDPVTADNSTSSEDTKLSGEEFLFEDLFLGTLL